MYNTYTDPAFLNWLAQLFPLYAEVVLLSPDKASLEQALTQIRSDLHWREASAQVDWLVVCGVLECQLDPLEALKQWRNWLSPTGKLLLSFPNLRYLPRLLTLLQGHWPWSWNSPQTQALTSESVLSLLPEADLAALELSAQHHPLPLKAGVHAALASTGCDLSGFEADCAISQWYLMAGPLAQQSGPSETVPLPLEGLRAHNLLLPLNPNPTHLCWQALRSYLTQIPPESDCCCVLYPLEADFDPQVWQEKLMQWLATELLDPQQIPDLLLPDTAVSPQAYPQLLASTETLILADTPSEWRNWARDQGKYLLCVSAADLPLGWNPNRIWRDWAHLAANLKRRS